MHLSPGAVYVGQLLNCPEFKLASSVEDHVRILDLLVLFVEASEFNPNFRGFAYSLHRVNRLDGLSESLDGQVDVFFAQLEPADPLVYVVRVLSEHHVRE